jgi:hypothetical protein
MVEEPSHEKQLSLILVCKIGLNFFFLFSHRSLSVLVFSVIFPRIWNKENPGIIHVLSFIHEFSD